MRVMTFGCSFTKYHWPTWADIVLEQAKSAGTDGDNWGMAGVGNLFIAMQVQHAIAQGLLKAGDHAFISWTHEWDHKLKTAQQPLRYPDFPYVQSKNRQWGF